MPASFSGPSADAPLDVKHKIAPTKPAIAILGHVLLTAADGQLSLYTTDSELGLATRCEAQVAVPGALTLPVTKLLSLVEQFPDADVTFTAERAALEFREPPSVLTLREQLLAARHAAVTGAGWPN